MLNCPFNHWEFSRLVYKGGGSAEVKIETPKRQKDKEKSLPEVAFDPEKTTHDDVWGLIDEKYGKTAYESLITSYVDSIMGSGPEGYKDALIKASSQRYAKFYEKTKLTFMTEADELKDKFDDAVDDIKDHVGDQLDILKSGIEGAKKQVEFNAATPSPSNEKAVESHFDGYLDSLNARYFNTDVNFGTDVTEIPIPIVGAMAPKGLSAAAYRNKAKDFQGKMKDWMEAKLEWMLANKKTSKQDLDRFKEEVEARYKLYSTIKDKNSAIISGADLLELDRKANPPLDAIGRILDSSDKVVIERLELIQLMNPDTWEETVDMARKVVMRGVVNNASQNKFVAAMKKYGTVKDFDEAEDLFEEKLEKLAKADVRATLEFIQAFNQDVHSEVLQYESTVEPPALTIQVHKQMDYLLAGVLVPHKQEDKAIVEFMKADKKGRDAILSNTGTRAVLFRAIKMATELYPGMYDKQFGNIPDDVTKLRRSKRIEKPTYHDRAAQLQALIILGNQAKVIVSKFEQTPDHKGKGYGDELDAAQVPDEAKLIKLGLRFKSSGNKTTRYSSGLSRGGFNGRDLALKGVKVLGVLAIVSNTAQSWSETSGDLPDRILDTIERTVTNPGAIAGAAMTAGSHLAERNKAFLRYPWLSQHERAGAMAAFKLDNLGRRLGHDEVKRFTHNNAEWRVLKHQSMDPSQIKEMIKEAGKRVKRGQKPEITIKDIKKVIQDESIISTLTTGGRSARMRYLFYQKFFASTSKPDVNHVKELCTGSGFIADTPVKEK